MNINIPCPECQLLCKKEMNDSGIYNITCANQHSCEVLLRNDKYSLLFDTGIDLLKNGYPRDAVNSFAVSIERFYEYCIRIMMVTADGPGRLSLRVENADEAFRMIGNQSERQLGAFLILYYRLIGQAPIVWGDKFVKSLSLDLSSKYKDPIAFRNAVTHKGFVPSYEGALNYGEAANKYMEIILHKIFMHFGYDMISIATTFPYDEYLRNIPDHKRGNIKVYWIDTFLQRKDSRLTREKLTNGSSLIEYIQGNQNH